MKINLPENIDLAHPERYMLAIYIRPDRFSFSLYNPVDDGSYFYQTFDNDQHADAFSNFKEVFFENDFFTLSFRKIRLVNHTSVFTYIPDLIYEDKHKKDYINFLFSENTGKFLSHSLQSGITILHQIPDEIYNFFARTFVNPEFIHHSASLIAYFQEKSNRVNARQMIVNKNGKEMDILCFSHGKFLLGNHFHCEQLQDAVYYILFIWKQLKFDQLKDLLHIAGDTASKKELPEPLKEYIYNIVPVNIVPEAHFDRVDTRNIPFELAALTLCEL
jgi:hypothetical protein